MKRIFKILFFCSFFASCDPMELQSPFNKHLDSEINRRLILLTTAEFGLHSNKDQNAAQIHKEIKAIIYPINLWDSSLRAIAKADDYFEKSAKQLGIPKDVFLKVSSSGSKPNVIVIIKRNELILLDQLLLNRIAKCLRKQIKS